MCVGATPRRYFTPRASTPSWVRNPTVSHYRILRTLLICGQGESEELVSAYEGLLRVEGENEPPIGVMVDLTDGRMRVSAGDIEVADWSLDEVRISALLDGFHVRAEGDEVVLEIEDEGHFALDLGLKSGHPALRRKMAALMRDDD